MNKTAKTVTLALSAAAALCLAALYLPPLQASVIALVERLKDDDIRDVFWKQQMFAFATCGILFLAILNLILWTKRGRDIFASFRSAVNQECAFINQNKKYFIFLLAVYFLGYFTIIRNNFCYIAMDDLSRQLEGDRDWVNWYRYIDEFASILIHTSPRLIDIAPLTQFIALFFVALASFATVQSATNNKMTYKACLASLPIGLFPYFLTNMAYRFDSPYMALSVFACAMPFAFKKNQAAYILSSVIGLLVMCTSYQASSGIYIVLAMFTVLKMILDKENWKDIGKFVLISVLCFVGTLAFFNLTFMEREFKEGSVDERMNVLNVLANVKIYIGLVWSGLGKSFLKALIVLSLFFGLFCTVVFAKQNKIQALVFTVVFYALAMPLSYGVYLAMGTPLWLPRAMYGIGFFVAAALLLIATDVESNKGCVRKISSVLIFATSYCCLAFAFAYGNAQFQQNKYAEFRMALLANDLSKIMSDGTPEETKELLFVNGIDYAPAAESLISSYPLASSCIDRYSTGGRASQNILRALNFLELKSGDSHHLDNQGLPLLLETSFHKIYGSGNKYLVSFKNEPLNVIRTRGFVEE